LETRAQGNGDFRGRGTCQQLGRVRHVTTLLPVWRLWSFRVIEICIEQ